MKETVQAEATKDFFINMLTRDIQLHDCVLDLADNCIDGANRVLAKTAPQLPDERRYEGFEISITSSPSAFTISDNCGGISIDLAKSRVFHFGRPKGGIDAIDHSIGLYGIGMKRALFKMGSDSEVVSATDDEAFRVGINVRTWETTPDWTFDLERIPKFAPAGTRITVKDLKPEISRDLGDPVFLTTLKRIIARDYAFFLQKGMKISVNGSPIAAHRFELRAGAEVEPVHYSYLDDGVEVSLSAGMANLPEDDTSPTDERTKVDYFGWFVVCNDRIVLAADKTNKTVWGDDGFLVWHPQYNGFMGLVAFSSRDASKLPWSTTKRDVDKASALYQRAVAKMKAATKQYTTYSNARRVALTEAKEAESRSVPISLKQLKPATVMRLPRVSTSSAYVTVSYQAARTDVKKVATALGSPSMAATRVGQKTFEYFMENEL